jgi:hypothetical protein
MPIYIQKMAGLLFLEWLSAAGEFAFKVTQDIIQILPSRLISPKEFSILNCQKLYSTEL